MTTFSPLDSVTRNVLISPVTEEVRVLLSKATWPGVATPGQDPGPALALAQL